MVLNELLRLLANGKSLRASVCRHPADSARSRKDIAQEASGAFLRCPDENKEQPFRNIAHTRFHRSDSNYALQNKQHKPFVVPTNTRMLGLAALSPVSTRRYGRPRANSSP